MSEPRPGRRERSRQRLLDAAFALLAERGFEGATAADVSHAADLAVGTFYNHFADKAALKAELVTAAAAGHRVLLDWATARAVDPAERLALAVKASVLRAARLKDWAGFVGRFGLGEPELREALSGGMEGDAAFAVAGVVVAFSALAAERQSDGVAEAESAALAVLRAVGMSEAAAWIPLPE